MVLTRSQARTLYFQFIEAVQAFRPSEGGRGAYECMSELARRRDNHNDNEVLVKLYNIAIAKVFDEANVEGSVGVFLTPRCKWWKPDVVVVLPVGEVGQDNVYFQFIEAVQDFRPSKSSGPYQCTYQLAKRGDEHNDNEILVELYDIAIRKVFDEANLQYCKLF